ncbi:DNA repair protein RadA/Sms [Candidatus Kinetoplastibacterium blastocrithidii TCC012E]|uniref:DNA repair protein RadA n=1 Tax=Candidatus Kinetoplastidibacterium blastocrithidiae TCC012E TaxID=1208922 RepID=M1LVP9_9PROT|nr:DNA repair protein RadA [Candidatus Kinetoplastibacterium blastocrithidii]AFZ83892.1 DNA repair protein RadA/Sms [Candidatus Kinetoplastibacterium blastocrithidii (ex Strigomonas culicis)]AGF49627.1 DNA repair protein RadA/Sms [Candidatus Kinetoplastibacterium blastocrithidii TCC012E]
MSKSNYRCLKCEYIAHKWLGKCPGCDSWNSFSTSYANDSLYKKASTNIDEIKILSEIEVSRSNRIPIGINEFDRVLGGGLVLGSIVLIGGDPGIGKSTLILQSLSLLSQDNNVLYVTGEESIEQLALHAFRLGLSTKKINVLSEIDLDKIISSAIVARSKIIVIDSIQTVFSHSSSSAPGSVSQVRECAIQITRMAKKFGITVLIIGHVTKDGSLAGPRILEHIVDTVLYFEGDNHSSFRIIRSFKNRFGPVNEIGAFMMTDKGLLGVINPSALFLSKHRDKVTGSCIMVTQEGSRPLLIEIQALVNTSASNRRLLTVGFDSNRLSMLLAVMNRHAKLSTIDKDVFINIVGGVRIIEPAADLPVLLAIYSSLVNKPLPLKMISFGEVGLAGEIRASSNSNDRLKEAVKLGFNIALIPTSNKPSKIIDGIEILTASRLEDSFRIIKSI